MQHRNRLPKEAGGSPSSQVSKAQLCQDTAKVTQYRWLRRRMAQMILRGPFQPTFPGVSEWLNGLFLFPSIPKQNKTTFLSSEATLYCCLIPNIFNNLLFNISKQQNGCGSFDCKLSCSHRIRDTYRSFKFVGFKWTYSQVTNFFLVLFLILFISL